MSEERFRTDEVNERIRLIQMKTGLTFGSDAYLLYAYMKRKIGGRAAELGCGSGIISLLAAAKGKFAHISAFEIQDEFAGIARENAESNGLSDKIAVFCADIRSLPAGIELGAFDAVFANPPYLKASGGRKNEAPEKYIARHEACGDIGDFCASAAKLLKFGGAFYAVYRPDRTADLLYAMKESGIEPKRMTLVYPDAVSKPCMLLVEGKRGSAPGMYMTPALIMYKDAATVPPEYTGDLKYIYENGEFDERYGKA